MSTYRWNPDLECMVNKKTGERMLTGGPNGGPPLDEEICAPMVMRDMPEHEGPSGRWITSRSYFRDECKRTGSVPFDRGLKGGVGGYIDPKVAKANGKKFDPELQAKWKHDGKERLKAAGL